MKKIALLLITLLTTFLSQAQDVQSFVNHQLQTYPKSRLLDLYKSCFQDFMGAEHLVSDKQRVKAYLDDELNIRSANSSRRPSVDEWNERWHKMIGTIDGMQLNLPQYDKDRQFIDSVLSVGKYAISHSPEYREAYRPHYRIVERSIFEQEILPLIEQKTMIVRIAEIEVYPEYLKDYLKAARNVGSESVRKEPGVICIFPNQVRADETKIRIVEIYRNKEAYQHHLTTPHFQAYKQGTLHMVKSLNLLDIQPLAPDAMQQIFIKLQ